MKKLLISLLLLVFSTVTIAEEVDPFEETNRAVYEFNEAIDDNLLEPVSRAYKDNTPDFLQNRVSHFFGNLRDVSTLANQILQFKIEQGAITLSRVLVNSTIGLYGLFDVATDMSLTTENEDFGQTLAVWGVDSGPFIMLPLMGPSTLRDGAGMYVDMTSDANLVNELDDVGALSASAMNIIDKRVELLPITDLLDQSDDPYITMRSSYLQKRKFDIFDGNLPVEKDEF
ncbi:VacJ family lipoprotein [Candidatus Thioglobus sp.]|nr:VacJ family lipoprotein [Candidatus Thioglobus sp.]MDB9829191.1 VacJ family lipoprotein [Candidatus Thioglobus sp.]MDC0888793.1 VacJ family lipoprotein [Candidatus Thioglobus sp.]MDC0904684.1 VacJ family lipoprotein [Candidatus Thioglobus sp.]MDC0920209.1 VacJ family lipoprotein [Candidatus Thioglobus sp.]